MSEFVVVPIDDNGKGKIDIMPWVSECVIIPVKRVSEYPLGMEVTHFNIILWHCAN